jgi:GrpB-like predicted nucleotidyltransferase (UPF0157 family)
MHVVVVPYDPRWPAQFRATRDSLASVLDGVPVRSIEHVGSTSVPGLAAKPRIDVDVVVRAEHLATARAALEAAGYAWLGEQGVTDRHAFRAPDRAPPRNVYVVVEGCLALRNHLAVRDLLRRDAGLRDEYGQLKLELARRDYEDIDQYVVDKSPAIQRILAAAGISDEDRSAIDAMNRGTGEHPTG